MVPAIAIFLSLGFLSVVFVAVASFLGYRLTPEHRRTQYLPWLLPWSAKGLFLPAALWVVMNLGVSWSFQPFMPEVQAAKNSGGDWVAEFLRVAGIGIFIISSNWTAATLAWGLIRAGTALTGPRRTDFRGMCWTCGLVMVVPAGLILLLGGWFTLGMAVSALVLPMAGFAPGILRQQKLPPMYARAIARMKFGRYTEAEWEIIHQLERCEDDFEGWLMLAELYANHFSDLAEAEQTILEICDHPKVTPTQLSVSLHRLADWYLKLANDPDAARRALQVICDRTRGTHLARMAELRIHQLPATAEELRARQTVQPIPLPALGDSLDEAPATLDSEADHDQALAAANACVEKLKQDPNNVPAREKLARLFAQRLNQAELGLEQVNHLLNMPDQPEAKRAEWLALAAAWHLRYRQDTDTGRRVLERVIQEFPHTPQALAARRRIQVLDSQGYTG